MEIITKLSSHKSDNREEMMALQTMKLLINNELKEQIITYQWGEIEVIKEELSTKLETIILIATVKGRTWQLTKISESIHPTRTTGSNDHCRNRDRSTLRWGRTLPKIL
ncbi:MAG: hypothetical protein RR550_01010 [Rikenellaceae bacterium]